MGWIFGTVAVVFVLCKFAQHNLAAATEQTRVRISAEGEITTRTH